MRKRFEAARAEMDRLFQLIDVQTLYERPVADRHRLVFYLGHVDAFDWNLICRGHLGMAPFHEAFDRLFAFGIDPEPGQAPSDTPSDWPGVDEVRCYNAETRRTIDLVLPEVPGHIAEMALEHRLMHAETFAYLLHNLSGGRKRFVPQEHRTGAAPCEEMIDIPAGHATLGQVPQEFGWDNEFEQHTVDVASFRVSKHKVSNGDYLRFVRQGAPPPHFWAPGPGGQWLWRGMFDEIALPLDWPVYVTHAEASAYAAWCGKSLLTEAQFHRAAYGDPEGGERAFPWGGGEPCSVPGNFDFRRWDPEPVTANPAADSAFGVSQLVGNGWEWTATAFAPFAGFARHPLYAGYSEPFFDGKHFVLKGGSPRTAACMLRRSFRNWFRAEYPYVYATFRLAENR